MNSRWNSSTSSWSGAAGTEYARTGSSMQEMRRPSLNGHIQLPIAIEFANGEPHALNLQVQPHSRIRQPVRRPTQEVGYVVSGLLEIEIDGIYKTMLLLKKKKYAALEAKQKETQDMLNSATVKLNSCLAEKSTLETNLRDQIADLKQTNRDLIDTQGNLTTLSTKGAENLERSLESIKEKDLQIKAFRDALNKKDSVTLALVTSLKGALGNLNDQDIEVNVEKGVV